MTDLTSTEQRKARAIEKRTGIVPGPNSPLLQVSGRAVRTEDAEEQLCDDYICGITGPSGVVRLSQRRASMVEVGLSDRRYRVYGAAFFFEVKAEDGQLTPEQHEFLISELSYGAIAGVGTLDDLKALVGMLSQLRRWHPTSAHHERIAMLTELVRFCREQVGRWATKGYRATPSPRQRRKKR